MAVASPSTRWSILLTVFRGLMYDCRGGRGLKNVSSSGRMVGGTLVEGRRAGGVEGGGLVGALDGGFLLGVVVDS